MPLFSDNPSPSLLFAETVDPANPAAGHQRLFVDTDHILKLRDSAGTVTALGAGFSNPMTTAGDLIVGGASGAPGRLAAGSTSGHVLTSNGSGVAPSYQAAAGGGSSRPYIDTLTLHATYGDDFAGSLDTGKWTRRTVTSGEETANVGSSNGWMAVDFSSGAASRLYLQTAPAGDFEIILSMAQWASASGHMCGPVIIDSSGAGVAAFFYNSSVLFYLGVLSAYAYASFPQTLFVEDIETSTTRMWIGLRKVGTAYSVRYSLNGEVWSPYSATSTQSFTVDRIGFGRVLGTPTAHRMVVDRFNVI